MVETLYRTLAEQGVMLKTQGADISFDAPAGVLTDDFRNQLRGCKNEMLAYLVEVEEAAAVLELEQGNAPGLSHVTATKRVNERRDSDRESEEKKAIRRRWDFMNVEAACLSALGCGLEIISVTRLEKQFKEAA